MATDELWCLGGSLLSWLGGQGGNEYGNERKRAAPQDGSEVSGGVRSLLVLRL